MKIKAATPALLIALVLGSTTAAFAESNTGVDRWLQGVSRSTSQPSAHSLAPYGYEAPGGATRVLNVSAGTRYINVAQAETVKINVDGKSVNWTFDTLGTHAFPLSKIVPAAGTDKVTVYVAANPLYVPNN